MRQGRKELPVHEGVECAIRYTALTAFHGVDAQCIVIAGGANQQALSEAWRRR
jgi:hypothetical protein